MMKRSILVAGLASTGLAAVLFGCGGSGSSGGGGGGGTLPALSMTASPTSVAADGSSAATISLVARDTQGKPVPGEQLTLTATGSGNIVTQPDPTDALGQTTGKIASTVPETKTITAIGPLTSQTATATITFTTAPTNSVGQPKNLVLISGDRQSGAPGTILPLPLVVRVIDASGNGVANVPVVFAVTTGNGSLSGTQATTDVNGQAAENYALGMTAGNNSIVVAARDFQGNNLTGSPLTFNETATSTTAGH